MLRNDIGRLFAVVHINGVQRKITEEDVLVLQKPMAANVGDRIVLNKVRVLHVGLGRGVVMCKFLPISRACFYCGV